MTLTVARMSAPQLLRLPSTDLMHLAARCSQLHLLPPHTLAGMLRRLQVR